MMEDDDWNGEDEILTGNLERDEFRECSECNMEYDGSCPMNSSDCPFAYEGEDEDFFDDDGEDDSGDFEDIDDIDLVLEYDEEAEKLIAEEEKISQEDLIGDDSYLVEVAEEELEVPEFEEGEGEGEEEDDLPSIQEDVLDDFEP